MPFRVGRRESINHDKKSKLIKYLVNYITHAIFHYADV
jgi:hypothetical protein